MNEMRFSILLSPILLHKWCVLRVSSMRALLTNYLSTDAVQQCCESHIDNATALRHLRRHVIVSQNDQLYDSILTHCRSKYEALQELVQCMWVEMDENEEEGKQQDPEAELMEAQYNLLMKKSKILPILIRASLDMNTLEELLKRHLSAEDVGQLIAEVDNNIAVALFHKKLLLTNRKSFFQQFVSMCRTQRDNFQACVIFMKNENGNELDDANYDNVDDIPFLPQHTDELTLIKSQLAELRSALLGAVNDVMNRMRQYVNKKDLKNAETLNRLNLSITNLQSMMDQCNARILQMEDQLPQIQETLQMQIQELSENLKATGHEHQERLAKLKKNQQVRMNELKAQNEIQDARIARLEANAIAMDRFETVEQAIPFKLSPSEKMIRTLNHYQLYGLSPIMSDKFGKYETIDWNKLDGNVNWNDQWMRMKRKEYGWIALPPLALPREYGECVIVLWIVWKNDRLEMLGGIAFETGKWIAIPDSIAIDGQICVVINGQIIKRERRIFKALKSHWSILLVISETIHADWSLPTVDLRVFP